MGHSETRPAIDYVDVPNQLGRRGRYSMSSEIQQRCYLALVETIGANHKSPTMQELANVMGVPNNRRGVASKAVADLERLGWVGVRRHPLNGKARYRGIFLLLPVLPNLSPLPRKEGK